MMSFTPTPTQHTGDENPGGTIRQGEGFGLGKLDFSPFGNVRRRSSKYQQAARTMGEAGRNVGKSAKIKAGGPCLLSRPFGSVIVKGALRGATFVQAGGPADGSTRTLLVEFNEVVFSSGPVPGGIGC
jgi:hypothetical protein